MKHTLLKAAAAVLLLAGSALVSFAPAAEKAENATTQPGAAGAEGAAKFYGSITAVDPKAMTFTIGEQTFTVVGETQMSKDDKAATIADAVVGEPARGTYTKAENGTLQVTKVRFGKK